MNRAYKTALALALVALQFPAPSAFAHPGHSLDAYGPLHVVTSPYHVGLLALTAVALGFGARFVKRRMPRRVLQACGLAALVAAGVLWVVSAT